MHRMSNFTKTAGVFEATLAKRYIRRLHSERIPHFVQQADENLIQILVAPDDLDSAIDLHPEPGIDRSSAVDKKSIPSRVLITIVVGVIFGSAVGKLLGIGSAFFALVGVVVLIAISESKIAK